jgi:hypothetical protein
MSELQEIDVVILRDGKTRVEIRGMKGQSCLDVTRRLEALLGGQVVDREYTDEFHQQAASTTHLTVERRDKS